MKLRSHRRGFALLTAITLLGLVAMTLLSITLLLTSTARRTRSAAADAQLRQLLLAGADAGSKEDVLVVAEKHPVPLPGRLADADLSWQAVEASEARRVLRIDARVGQSRRSERVELSNVDGRWVVVAAALD